MKVMYRFTWPLGLLQACLFSLFFTMTLYHLWLEGSRLLPENMAKLVSLLVVFMWVIALSFLLDLSGRRMTLLSKTAQEAANQAHHDKRKQSFSQYHCDQLTSYQALFKAGCQEITVCLLPLGLLIGLLPLLFPRVCSAELNSLCQGLGLAIMGLTWLFPYSRWVLGEGRTRQSFLIVMSVGLFAAGWHVLTTDAIFHWASFVMQSVLYGLLGLSLLWLLPLPRLSVEPESFAFRTDDPRFLFTRKKERS